MSHDGHEHHHRHEMNDDKAEALLKYMLEHNLHHADELHDIAHKLEHLGKQAAADAVHESLEAYSTGNEHLKRAIAALGE